MKLALARDAGKEPEENELSCKKNTLLLLFSLLLLLLLLLGWLFFCFPAWWSRGRAVPGAPPLPAQPLPLPMLSDPFSKELYQNQLMENHASPVDSTAEGPHQPLKQGGQQGCWGGRGARVGHRVLI